MADLNNISIIGRTTREINEKDFGYTPNGKAKLNLSIAVDEGYGENKSVSFFDVTYWGKPAESIKPYITKGKQLAIDGRLKQDRWEKDGNKYSRIYIIANNIQLLGGKSENTQSAPAPRQSSGSYESAQADNGGGYDPQSAQDFPEDIPF